MHFRWEFLLVLVLCMLLTWLSLRERLPAWLGGEAEIAVSVAAVRKRAVPLTVAVSGTLAPAKAVTVVSRLAGRVTEMRFKIGDAVPAGAVVATVFFRDLVNREIDIEAGLGAARKDLHEKEEQLLAAEKLVAQSRELLQRDLIARRDLEQAEAAAQTGRAQVELSRARLAQREAMLNQARKIQTLAQIVAPVAGIVSRIWVEPGATIRESSPLLDIANESASQFSGRIIGDLSSGIHEGMSAQVWSAALAEKKFEGTLVRLEAGRGNGAAAAAVEIQIKNEAPAVSAAVAAQGLILLDQTTEALLVPRAAVIDSGGKQFLFKLNAGRALRQPVTLGATEGDWVIVQQGLSETDVVIIDNLRSIKPGGRVRALATN
jgi:membrane fusion protein (multidrug efflux system)